MTCEDFKKLVDKDFEEQTAAERFGIVSHAILCKTCLEWVIHLYKMEGSTFSEVEKVAIKEKAMAMRIKDRQDPEIAEGFEMLHTHKKTDIVEAVKRIKEETA